MKNHGDVGIFIINSKACIKEYGEAELKVWADRFLFYAAKMYTGQIEPGQKYNVFKKCVSINILDFILFERGEDEKEQFYSCFHIMEDTRHFRYTDKMEFHVIELPKLPKELKADSSRVELWAKFINAEEMEEFDMIAEKDPYIKSAYDQLQIISQDKQKRMEYEAREKAILDYNQSIYEAEQRTAIQIAKNMIADNIPEATVSKLTGLPLNKVKTLLNKQ